MSTSQRIAFAVSISWFGRLSVVLSGLVLTPILFRYLRKEELGIWYLLINSQSFLMLLGLGITPTLTRHIALAKGKSGADPGVELTRETQQNIGDLLATGRLILRWLAVVVFLIGLVSGYSLINQIKLTEISQDQVFWAWTMICAGYAVGVWLSYIGCLLTGMGYVGWESLIGMTTYFLVILINIAVVILGGRILALTVISVVASLFQASMALVLIRWRFPELLSFQGNWNVEYAKALVKPSLYWWLTDLGAFLVLRTDAYFIALFKGYQNVPSYQAAYNLVLNLSQLAIAISYSSAVFISQAWQAGAISTIQQMTLRNARLGLSIMAAGVAFLMMAGREFIELWLGKGNFVGQNILLVFCMMLTLEAQHVILVTSSRATEDEKYAPFALSAGVLNVVITWVLIKPLGLLGVAMGTMLAQMLTSNWYGVYRPMVRLRLNFRVYLRQVVGLWAVVLVCCLSLSWLVKKSLLLLGINSAWAVISATATVCVAVFSISSWMNVLEDHHRQIVQAKLGGWLRRWEF
ncbi:membrane protein involved in the export of O-antigen and teichoic acid [Cylindrospermum stagnale PCC 7417]|uniref:Membrane protein involved in the export of O-antigen and teichoic acid n=1 Tax=Cylindrospermum stagnale PCC 7417 TaxID=56107 RepID=K9WQW5_9NOST|nr:oligosaccharide flippase family protein [Cylindrospermum stagnale]AFZ22785.1 membrane protein involved in the export of O-antigen and teichoic acid [Cylindrospermum stagnale PCC 7417]